MKKLFLSVITLLFVCLSYSQNSFLGLFGSSYLQNTSRGSTKMERINKPISIIYNSGYCSFYLEGNGVKFFPIRSFSRTIGGGGYITSFVSQETSTTPDGYYGIIIQENKDGINFQVNLNQFTYYVDKVEKYSENGKVDGRISLKNYDELMRQTRQNDSLFQIKVKESIDSEVKSKYEDSIYFEKRRDSLRLVEEKKLLEGNNYNSVNLGWINDTIQSNINIDENETFYNPFRVSIDERGIITKIEPDGKKGSVIEKYLPLISEIIVGRKVQPYKSKTNEKYYPSYTIVNVSLYHDPNKKGKKKKPLGLISF